MPAARKIPPIISARLDDSERAVVNAPPIFIPKNRFPARAGCADVGPFKDQMGNRRISAQLIVYRIAACAGHARGRGETWRSRGMIGAANVDFDRAIIWKQVTVLDV